MESFKNAASRKVDWGIAGALGAVAALVYFLGKASYVYPGESARLTAVWAGLDVAKFEAHPLMAAFAKLLGGGNLLAPVCGVIATVCVYHLVNFFVRERIGGEFMSKFADAAGRIAGATAAGIFLFTPAVTEAATHLEPRMFSATWTLLTAALLIVMARAPRGLNALMPAAVGVMLGLGMIESPSMLLLAPFFVLAVAVIRRKQERRPYGASAAVVFFTILAFFAVAPHATGDFTEYLRASWTTMRGYWSTPGWLFVAAFSTLPFFTSLVSSNKAYNKDNGLMEWTFHLSMSVASVLAVATPMSPSSQMARFAVLPVLTSAFAAIVVGYLAAYWWLLIKASVRDFEQPEGNSGDKPAAAPVSAGKQIAYVALPTLGLVWFFAVVLNLFAFEPDRGAFADYTAERIVADLGSRHWLVTDGMLDDHIRLAAARKGADVRLICLQRDLDDDYLRRLSDQVAADGVGGARAADLQLSLALGVLPFVQDWFATDPEAAKDVAVFGAPDLWYSAGMKAVPELLFFGADPAREPDWKDWAEFDKVLSAPKGWGSYRLYRVENPVDRMRLNMRRHMGLVATDRGVFLQDEGRADEAFAMYELVLDAIDADNVSALFNEFEMSRQGMPKAVAKKNEIERKLKTIVDDADRRYRLWSLGNYYGYIRSPEVFIRLGFTWARSGRPGEALNHIRRAIDLIPSDKRSTMANLLAALYANDNNRVKGREAYEQILQGDALNHDALIGMMRIELMDGNYEKAIGYLERASEADKTGPRADMEKAMLALMKGDLVASRAQLAKIIEAEEGNLQAWSLMAAVTMQQCDAAKDPAVKKTFAKELEEKILPTMEKQSRGPFDYYVLTTRAFILMRKNAESREAARENREAARAALVNAAKARPDVAATQDLVLGLDISLNDPASAEKHAREVLRKNRRAPLANYVMGSLELQKGNLQTAETYLRRSVDTPKPVAVALNDLAEVLRRGKKYDEAEAFARKATATDARLYVAWETLGTIIVEAGKDLDEAEECIRKACEYSKVKGREEDVRMLISLARVQLKKGDKLSGKSTLGKVKGREEDLANLSEFERKEYEELLNSAR